MENNNSETLIWRSFFWVTATLMTMMVLALPQLPRFSIFDYIDVVFSVFLAIALYGFAYQKPLISVVFWRYFFYAAAIEFALFAIVLPIAKVPLYNQQTQFNFFYIVSFIYAVCLLYAVYQYAYKRSSIWAEN